jgi:hypothetical protein
MTDGEVFKAISQNLSPFFVFKGKKITAMFMTVI